ncbi:MAG: SDR family NAD(P)-dependent oxidoreductase [bacterium]|nr:SDR family NAD(P)-dependent oxidoreductase [bacterium]
MTSNFTGTTVIVTGGAKGIGRGICLGFARAGAAVLCADIDTAAGVELAAEPISGTGEIRFQRADASQASACQGLVDTATELWGGAGVVCNNVGIQPTDCYLPAHELSEAAWDRIINVNLKSAFLMTRACIPGMITRRKGVIINTASVQGLQSAKGVSAYAASKGGILSLTRQLALEYAEYGIRVLAVNPGTIDTPLVDEALAAVGGDEAAARVHMAALHPLGRIGQPEDVANLVMFLASDGASFMTGENICVDGGLMARGSWG